MIIQHPKNLTLATVQSLFQLEERLDGAFSDLLSLTPLTEAEQKELDQIRSDYRHYLANGKVSEGQVKFLVISPLMRLAGFYWADFWISLEENVTEIVISEADVTIKGRIDILVVKRTSSEEETAFWVVVIESKNSEIAALAGLPQLLTYAYQSLTHQEFVWGLATNGVTYQFVYLQSGKPSTYQLLPDLSLIDRGRSYQLLQVLKAISASI